MGRGGIPVGIGVLLGVLLQAGGGAAAPRALPSGVSTGADTRWESRPPVQPAARRRWALARMDDMTREGARCRERFKAPRQIEECQNQYAHRYRQYNEIYLEAARE